MIGDAFGHLLDAVDRGRTHQVEIVERDDGLFFTGGGRVVVHLQERGHVVVGVERSPLVAKVARRRGARSVKVMGVDEVTRRRVGTFDTVVMFGNNLGMLGSPAKTRRLLRRLHHVTAADARVLAGNMDPYYTKDAVHLAYHERNRRLGKPPGTIRIRLRYQQYATRWFDWLFLSRDELEQLLAGTGWHVRAFLDDGPLYVAVLEKD